MPKSTFPYKLYLVISEKNCGNKSFLRVAQDAIRGGVDIIQLREKNLSMDTYLNKALRLKEITEKYNIPLIINDNLEVAQNIDAFGIHVGNKDISPALIREKWKTCPFIGYSIEHLYQLADDSIKTADYFGISPVFKTPTKSDTITEWGLKGIRRIRNLTSKPLVAIGNINLNNIPSVINAGADCIAVVSAICASDNPQRAASRLKNKIIKSI